jgi:hypothetical protein
VSVDQPVPGPTREQIAERIEFAYRSPLTADQWPLVAADQVMALLPARPSDDDPSKPERLKGKGTDVCSHGRPDHQELIRQLLEALGMSTAARPYSPAQLFSECLAEIEQLRREAVGHEARLATQAQTIRGDTVALNALAAEIERLRARPCPWVETSDEGTSHCRLAAGTDDEDRIARENRRRQ